METFSQLLATVIQGDRYLRINIELKSHGVVEYEASLNDQVFSDSIETTIHIFSPINFDIYLKEFVEGTSGVEIVKFTVNELEILPLYQHHANPPTNYIDTLGQWTMHIPNPFFQWYHKVSGQGWLIVPGIE
jgi:hypothetical protein